VPVGARFVGVVHATYSFMGPTVVVVVVGPHPFTSLLLMGCPVVSTL